jgi:hypothetical protein
MQILLFISCILAITTVLALDFHTKQCSSDSREWDCWSSQSCGTEAPECHGKAHNAPDFAAVNLPLVVTAVVIAATIVLAAIIGIVIFVSNVYYNK